MRIGKKRIHIKPSMVFLYVLMLALVLFTALPLVYMVSTAFKPLDELYIYPPRFLVRRPTGQNFYDLLISLGTVPLAVLPGAAYNRDMCRQAVLPEILDLHTWKEPV